LRRCSKLRALIGDTDCSTITFAVDGPITLRSGHLVIDRSLSIEGPAGGITVQRTTTRTGTLRVRRAALVGVLLLAAACSDDLGCP
jgi:hypothetical protein